MRGCDPRGRECGAFGAISDALAGECNGFKREGDGLSRGRADGPEGNVRRRLAWGLGRCSAGLRGRGTQGPLRGATVPHHPRAERGTAGLRTRIRKSRHNQIEASSPRRRHARETLRLSRAALRPHHSGEKTRPTNARSRHREVAHLDTQWSRIPPPYAVGAPLRYRHPGALRFASDGLALRSLARPGPAPLGFSFLLSQFQLFPLLPRPSLRHDFPANSPQLMADHRPPILPPRPQMHRPQQTHSRRPQVFTVHCSCNVHGSFNAGRDSPAHRGRAHGCLRFNTNITTPSAWSESTSNPTARTAPTRFCAKR